MILIKFLLLFVTLLPTDEKWYRIDTQEEISFLFPNTSQKLTKMVNGIPSAIYQTKDLTCVAGVVCTDFSSKNIPFTPENAQFLYDELKNGSLELETARLKEEKTIPHDSMFIKEIEYTIIKDKYEMTYFKRFIFRGNYIYQLSIGGRTRHLDMIREEKEIFFNSVSFSVSSKSENKVTE